MCGYVSQPIMTIELPRLNNKQYHTTAIMLTPSSIGATLSSGYFHPHAQSTEPEALPAHPSCGRDLLHYSVMMSSLSPQPQFVDGTETGFVAYNAVDSAREKCAGNSLERRISIS